jgi:hypothetical protein
VAWIIAAAGSKKGACNETPGGYLVTSKLTLKSDMKDEDRKMQSDLANISAGTCISSTEKGSRFLIVPFYDTPETPPNKAKYQVRYIDFTK